MKVWLRRIGIGLALVVVLLALAIGVALALIDTAALKRVIAEQVEAHTGRELTIEGDLGISIFPWIGFELGATRLANAPGFDERPFVALERAELRVRLLPLLQREVSVDRVVVHGLAVDLARDAAGRGNWEDLLPAAAAPAAGDAAAAEGVRAPDASSQLALRVEGVEVRDASLVWRDAATGEALTLRDLDLETGVLAPGVTTPVRLAVTLEPAGAPALEIELQTQARFDTAGPRLRLAGLGVDLQARGEDLPGGGLDARLGGDVDVDLGTGTVRLEPLAIGLADTVDARGRVIANTGGESPSVRGQLTVERFSPRALAGALGLVLPEGLDERALQTASVSLDFDARGQAVHIDGLELALDDTRASGSIRAQGGDLPAAELTLAVDAIELDRYLPPPAATNGGSAAGAAGPGPAGDDPVASLPLESMRGVRARAAIDIGRLGLRGLQATDVALRARLDDGLLTLERLGAGVAGGRLALGARLDGRREVPAAGLGLRIDGIQAAPLLQALTGTVPVSGRLDADLQFDTRGPTMDAWLGALNGKLATTFSDGAIEGINIAQRIRVAWARIQGGEVDAAARERRTDFSRLHFAGSVRDGVLRSDTLDLRAPLLRVGGSGEVDLVRQQVDYVARVLVTGTLQGQGGGGIEELRGLEIPLRLQGPLAGPKIELAMTDALEARAKAKREALRREAQEAEAKARRQLEQELEAEQRRLEEEKRKLEAKKEREKEKAKQKLEEKLKGLFD